MLRKGFLKPNISIEKLGKRNFWTGIIIGILASFILTYFFNYSREALRSVSFINDPYILTEKEFRIFDLFFAAFATSLGFGFTIIYWLRGRNKNIRRKYRVQFVIANSWFITFVALMIVARFGSVIGIILFSMPGYDNHLDFVNELWLLLLLIPVYVFFVQWNAIRMIFKTRKWLMISVIIFGFTVFYLFKTTYTDRNILNQSFYSRNKEQFDFIESEFQKARKHEVFFSDSLQKILQKQYAERTTNLVLDLQKSFKRNEIVPLDTLILEKIAIHNMKRHGLYYYNRRFEDIDRNWPYAMPEEIYCQIKKHEINSIETRLLFEILNEQISLFAIGEVYWEDYKKYSDYEVEKASFRRSMMYVTETIQWRIIQVANQLRSEKEYEKYFYLLPEFDFDSFRGRQKEVKISITCANNAL